MNRPIVISVLMLIYAAILVGVAATGGAHTSIDIAVAAVLAIAGVVTLARELSSRRG